MNLYTRRYHQRITSHLKHVKEPRLRDFLTCLLRNMSRSRVQVYDIRELKQRLNKKQWAYLVQVYLGNKPNATNRDALDKIAAWQTGNKIFMDVKQSLDQSTRDFVHEFTHYLRKSAQQPLQEQAYEEMHAFVAEHLVLRQHVPEKSLNSFAKMIWGKINHPTYRKLPKQGFKQVLNELWMLIQKPDRLLGRHCGPGSASLSPDSGSGTDTDSSGDDDDNDDRGIAGHGLVRLVPLTDADNLAVCEGASCELAPI
jgi:hypothetical protein